VRVRGLTKTAEGVVIPKQFWSPNGRASLLRRTIRRCEGLVSRERIVPVVAEQHRQWWQQELADIPAHNVVSQSHNRGTGIGILLPVMRILSRDPRAKVLILPTDHYVGREDVLRDACTSALRFAYERDSSVVLLGMKPPEADPDFGWIVPSSSPEGACRKVDSFVEKPDGATAVRLLRNGALLNSFIVVASAVALLELFEQSLPLLPDAFPTLEEESPRQLGRTTGLRHFPFYDFSRDVVQANLENVWVLPVQDCGWDDLGTPERLLRHFAAVRPGGIGS
jgi:mannose-1-phosphate guanylyltransferase